MDNNITTSRTDLPLTTGYVSVSTDTFNTTLCSIEIRKAENGYIAKQGGDEYVFKTTKQLFTWLEKELND